MTHSPQTKQSRWHVSHGVDCAFVSKSGRAFLFSSRKQYEVATYRSPGVSVLTRRRVALSKCRRDCISSLLHKQDKLTCNMMRHRARSGVKEVQGPAGHVTYHVISGLAIPKSRACSTQCRGHWSVAEQKIRGPQPEEQYFMHSLTWPP